MNYRYDDGFERINYFNVKGNRININDRVQNLISNENNRSNNSKNGFPLSVNNRYELSKDISSNDM